MGLLGRWADKFERKNVDLARYELERELKKHYPQLEIEKPASLSASLDDGLLTQVYISVLTRKGWNQSLWIALCEAQKQIDSLLLWKPDKKEEGDIYFFFVLIAYVDVNCAQRGIGAKLAASQIPLFDTALIATAIAEGYEAFLRKYPR